jgi:hypothetical protein
MPFHVEVSTGMRHARVFNRGHDELWREIVEPWLDERPIQLGDRDWDPGKSRLKILEGPELATPELSFGQGWANAERSAADVTRKTLAEVAEAKGHRPAPTAIEVEVDSLDRALAALGEMTAGRVARQIEWPAAQRRIDGRDAGVAAVVLITMRQPGAEPPRSES